MKSHRGTQEAAGELRAMADNTAPVSHQGGLAGGTGAQELWSEEAGQRWDPETPGFGDREAAGSRPRDL